ncbi:MAG: YHS domain-containing (seleno)protein [Cyclobacteriaceae bacterium]
MKNFILTIAVLVGSITITHAQVQPVDENGLAIGGYDVVAYFSNNAEKGSARYTATYEDATYQFVNAQNRDAFKKNPSRYLPQFDGYCAWGVAAKDSKFPINPETFDVIDGKLYLFFNGDFGGEAFNTAPLWNAETSKLKTAAHAKWPSVKTK